MTDERPVWNLVIEHGAGDVEGWAQVAAGMAPLANAAYASGHKLVITDTPQTGAAVYVIVTPGGAVDLSDESLELLYRRARVFLMTTDTLPTAPNWQAARRALGIGDSGTTFVEQPAQAGLYNGESYTVLAEDGDARLLDIVEADLDGANLAARADDGTVLIAGRDEHWFVNGTALDMEAAFPLSALAVPGAGLRAPTRAVVAVWDDAVVAVGTDGSAVDVVLAADGRRLYQHLAPGQFVIDLPDDEG